MGYYVALANGAHNTEGALPMNEIDRSHEDFDVALADPSRLIPGPPKAGAGRDGRSAAANMAAADAPTGQGGGTGKGTSESGATPKQRAFIESLAAERGLEVKAKWIATKASASAAIEDLLALPKTAAPAAAPTGARLATEKQMDFLRKLVSEKDFYSLVDSDRKKVTWFNNGGHPTAAGASALIDVLLVTVNDDRKVATPEIEAGVYVLPTGELVRVYFGQQSGHMLAKVVVDGDLEYKGKAERVLVPGSRKATVEEVGSWGRATGTCLVCSRKLDDPESVDRGIGPVCYGRMAG